MARAVARQKTVRRLTPRFLVKKGDRLYFSPPKYLRDLGIAPERLSDDPLEARRRAEALGAQADAVRMAARRATKATGGKAASAADLNPYRPGTVAWLIRKWAGDISDRNTPGASPEWRRLSERTRADYRRHLLALQELFGQLALAGITPRFCHAYKTRLSDPATGLISRWDHYRLQVLQALLAHGVTIGALGSNPAARLRVPTSPPRRAYWTDAQVEKFLAADPPPSIRLALMLGLHTGQRQSDVLHLRWSDIKDGWIELEQRKSRRAGRAAKRVAIPISPSLATELARAERTRAYVVMCETVERAYRQKYFQQLWRDATLKAGLDGLTFQDLRRSAVVRLAEAECSVGEIASWTGHSISETTAILNVYFVPTRPAAAAALVKLERRRQAEARP